MRSLVVLFLLCSPALAAPPFEHSIIYTESPAGSWLPDAWAPWIGCEAKIRQLDPDGTNTVLVDRGAKAAAWDHKKSLDGKWLFYAQCNDLTPSGWLHPGRARAGSDLWRMNLETGFREQITHQEIAPYGGRERRTHELGVWNMCPCPLADRLVFTSDREIPGQNQIYVCDFDGKNVEKVGFLNVGSALHPEVLSNGRLIFATQENQGVRSRIAWGLWTMLPDGRDFEPFFSSFFPDTIIHFQAETGNRQLVTVPYYALNNIGFGAPWVAPVESTGFEHRTTIPSAAFTEKFFLPKGAYELTPWTTWRDNASPLVDGKHVGKLSHPAATPDPTQILLTYAKGPVNLRDARNVPIDTGIYLCPVGQPTTGPEALTLLIDGPEQEWQAESLVPYSAIFGQAPFGSLPKQEPWLPNAGSEHLPAGTPFALIGTSSLYVRETDSLIVNFNNLSGLTEGRMDLIGGNRLPFPNSEIARLRILTTEWPTTDVGNHKHRTALNGDERLRIVGEIDVRRFDAQGNRIKDPAGNPDTSFLAKIRADEPFTFQLIDAEGRCLSHSGTWHNVRPGEIKVDCSGCHAHTKPEKRFDFEDAWAAKHSPADFTKAPARLVEYTRDVKPILEQRCLACHQTDLDFAPAADSALNYRFAVAALWRPFESKTTKLGRKLNTDANHTVTADELRTISEWIDTGGLIDKGEGLRDDTKPTLFIHSPRRQTQPVKEVIVSAADAELDPASLLVSLNGQALAMAPRGDGIWSASVPETASGQMVAEVRDRQGNSTKLVRTFTPGAEAPPQPPDETAQLRAELEELKALIRTAVSNLEAAIAPLKVNTQ